MPMDRRKFIRVSSAALVASQAPIAGYLDATAPPPYTATVYEADGIGKDQVEALFAVFGGLETWIKTDFARATVLIKPNLCLPHRAGRGTVTSPVLIEAVIQVLIGKGIKNIIIADHTLQETEDFSDIELVSIAEKYPEVKLVFANQERMFMPTEVNGKGLKQTDILKLLARASLFINLATAKHHQTTHVSLAIKNLMGAIWDRSIFHTSLEINQAIGDLALVIKPDLNIIDTSRVLLNNGPVGPGEVITENRIFASTDICAVDAVVVSRYNFGNRGVTAKEVPHIRAAWENGVGEIELEKILVEEVEGRK
ncbi:MAG: hypothetical protein B6I19_05810 [Bacteroidetes bacterium 4572_114]|nr:MAG: hypothetical protein B6I19_05810 [Bacteroidetes bacterium 4572_114]